MQVSELDFTKEDGLIPAIITEVDTGTILMLGYMNALALDKTLASGLVHFWSRSRNELWLKGEKSGDEIVVQNIKTDCDRDALLLSVRLLGTAVCHTGALSCFFTSIDKENV